VKLLSVVMPVYHELAVIEDVLREHREVLDERLPQDRTEIVVVDDGSTDGTAELLDRLAHDIPGLVVLHQERNRGPGPALHRALEAASGEWFLHVDADRQTDARDLWQLWDRRDDHDLLIGIRRPRRDPRHRRLLSWVTRYVVWVVGGRRFIDVNAPFKLARRDVWEDLRPAIPADAFAPSLLLAVGAARRGRRIAEIPVHHRMRPEGRTTFRLGRLVGAALAAGRQVVRFRWAVGRLPARQSR
jgi:glycosyltransferase involved in cell wall biosynthesis